MLWAKKIHTRNLITKKKFLRLENSPSHPHNFSNGPSLKTQRPQLQWAKKKWYAGPHTANIWPPGAKLIFFQKNFILKYFQKLMRFQLPLDQDKFMGKV